MLYVPHIRFILSAMVLLLAGDWVCLPAQAAPAASAPTLSRLHWSGMTRLSAETNAARLGTIWNLPQSRRLEQQTLDKLSLAPWRLLHRNIDTNAAALLRPLLDDLVADESYLQIRQVPNLPAELVLAIRLDDRRAALWQTNLGQVLKSLTGIPPVPAPGGRFGWSLKKHHTPNVLELTRVGGWTVFGAAQEMNGWLAELRARTQRNLPPWNVRSGSDWLEADLNPAQLANFFSLCTAGGEVPPLANFSSLSARAAGGEGRGEVGTGHENKSVGQPVLRSSTAEGGGEVGSANIFSLNPQLSTFNQFSRLYLAITGDGTNVLTQATMDFSEPLALELKPWIVPTNLIAEPITGITLVRGFKPRLESSAAWKNLQIGPAPDQVCAWAMQQFPMETYFAAPVPDASHEVSRLTDWVLQHQSATNQLTRFARSGNFNGLEWKGAPFATPFVRSVIVSNQGFIFGGGLAATVPGTLPLEVLQTSLVRTNLVYHDWEATGLRTDQWLYLTQFVRFILRKDQLPSESASVVWLKTVGPKLGRSITDVTQTGSNQLSYTRQSDIGFTALELNLLADWLESPQFPLGLYSVLTPPSIKL